MELEKLKNRSAEKIWLENSVWGLWSDEKNLPL